MRRYKSEPWWGVVFKLLKYNSVEDSVAFDFRSKWEITTIAAKTPHTNNNFFNHQSSLKPRACLKIMRLL